MDRTKLAYWESRASRPAGRPLPAPIRPTPEDAGFWESRLGALCGSSEPLRALLLGVTSSIATLRWPARTELLALDWSTAMIRRAWPAAGLPAWAAAVRGDWRQMPLRDASRDLAIGDGCYAALASFGDCNALNGEVARVLRDRGWYFLRCYLRPAAPQDPDALFAALHEGRVGEFEIFLWRLAMALHGEGRAGVRTDEVWRAWRERVPDHRPLFDRLGWSDAAHANMAQWGELRTRVPFPTLDEVAAMVAPRFELLECSYGSYEMGECCARLVMRKR